MAGVVAHPRLDAHADDPGAGRRGPRDPAEAVLRRSGDRVDLQRVLVLVLLAAERECVVARVLALEEGVRESTVRTVALGDRVAARLCRGRRKG